jgi:hypothetical protein
MVLRPKPRNYRGDFVGQITKPQLPILRPKLGNPSEWFSSKTARTVATCFEVKLEEIIDLDFKAKPRNMRSSSPYTWCRPHRVLSDLSIVQPPSTQPVLNYPQSSAPSLLLMPRSSSLPTMSYMLPTHHETSTRVSPHEKDSRVGPPKFPRFKIQTKASHLLVTNQTMILTILFLRMFNYNDDMSFLFSSFGDVNLIIGCLLIYQT